MAIKAGRYSAKILDYALVTTKGGDIAPSVLFEVYLPNDEGREQLRWQGSFKTGQAAEIALGYLETMGLQSGDDVKLLRMGIEGGVLDTEPTYDVKVEMRQQANARHFYPEIRGIYRAGSAGIQFKATDENEIDAKLDGLNLAATFANIKAKRPASDPRGDSLDAGF